MQNDPLDSTEPLASTRTGLGRVRAGQFPAVGAPPVGRLAAFSGRAV